MLKIIILALFIIQQSMSGQGFNCSAFIIDGENILLAKNFDWALGDGLIFFNPKNKLKNGIYYKTNKSSWISKYSSITFNQFGLNQPLGGMNEEGLTIEELSTWPVEYPNDDNLVLNEFEWIQYQLDKYSTTYEVISNIKRTSINKFYFQIHYLIVDKYGDIAIVEFIRGEPKIYHNETLPYPVLTNNNYSDLIRYSSLVSESRFNKLNVNYSQDRFLKIVMLLKRYNDSADYLYSMNLLDSVQVNDTQWSIVYDIHAQKIYYKTKSNDNIKGILFSKNLIGDNEFKFIPIGLKKNKFMTLNLNYNIEYLEDLIMDINMHFGKKGLELVNKINNYLK